MVDYQASEDAIAQFTEAFSFLTHEREDVRKMAVQGIAQHCKDNRDLWCFLSSAKTGPKAVDQLLQYLHAGASSILGDILTILINCSADGTCAEMLVDRKVVRKAMRLLDGMERSSQPLSFVRSVQEMTLMLLSNLTASYISAVDDLLQKDDEDMRGFYLGKLQQYYEFLRPKITKGEVEENTEEDDPKKEGAQPSVAAHRDLCRWILHILLNLTRSLDGQELLLEDEEWRITLLSSLSSPNPVHRLLAAQCYRNCACSQCPRFPQLVMSGALTTAVQQLSGGQERGLGEIQMCLAEIVASMLESEEGMQLLESINAKRLLTRAIVATRATSGAVVEVLEEDGRPAAATTSGGAPLEEDVSAFLERHVIPYLDDIIDAYVPECEEID